MKDLGPSGWSITEFSSEQKWCNIFQVLKAKNQLQWTLYLGQEAPEMKGKEKCLQPREVTVATVPLNTKEINQTETLWRIQLLSLLWLCVCLFVSRNPRTSKRKRQNPQCVKMRINKIDCTSHVHLESYLVMGAKTGTASEDVLGMYRESTEDTCVF